MIPCVYRHLQHVHGYGRATTSTSCFNVSRHLLKAGVLPDSLLEMSGLLIIMKSLGLSIDTDEH